MDRLEIKAAITVDDAGTITGMAWPFGSADSSNDIITKGAFSFTVPELPMLYGHNPDDLIGTWNEASETADGLVTKGTLHMEQPRARAVHSLIKGGFVTGLSIGFKTKAFTRQGRNRVISALDLSKSALCAIQCIPALGLSAPNLKTRPLPSPRPSTAPRQR